PATVTWSIVRSAAPSDRVIKMNAAQIMKHRKNSYAMRAPSTLQASSPAADLCRTRRNSLPRSDGSAYLESPWRQPDSIDRIAALLPAEGHSSIPDLSAAHSPVPLPASSDRRESKSYGNRS